MKFFNHYTVISSKIKLNLQSRAAVPIHVALSVSGSTTVSTDYTVNIENGELIYCPLNPVGIAGSAVTLTTASNAGAFQGIQNVLDDPNMRGDAASQPTEQIYFVMTCWDPITAAAPLLYMDCYIEYDVMFHEPRKAALD